MSKLMSETNELVDYNEEEDNQVPAVPLQESQEATSKWGAFGWDKSQGSLCWSGRFWVPILFLEGRNHEGDIGVWIWASLWGHFFIFACNFLVQSQCIPKALMRGDILCQARSGMGKTCVFVISVLQNIKHSDHVRFPHTPLTHRPPASSSATRARWRSR